ncbi:MAG: hypothetical protein ABIS50_22455 [Luteolibacter sp.]|uniref:hypothetical protein n=1 Tax=Luteolibacter sp. TaxID=1962973 RepID=UPI003264FC09
MKERKSTDKELRLLAAWNLFLEKENGCIPSTLAALTLRMTTSGVYNAAQRGYLVFFQVGRDRWYGMKSVLQYKHSVSRRFPSNRVQPAKKPQNFFPDLEAEN